MKNYFPCGPLLVSCLVAFCPAAGQAQAPAGNAVPNEVLEIRGDRKPAEAEKLSAIWLYPEDYLGKRVKLQGFIFEAENFEYFPEQNGYLFSCEPVIYGRNNAFHVHVGNATFLSREKLNFFCSTAEGQRIRQLFKTHPDELAVPANVVLEIRQRDGIYFADLISFAPKHEAP